MLVNLELEQWSLHPVTMELLATLARDEALADWDRLGIVSQAYLRRSDEAFERLLALARSANCYRA